MAIGRKYVQGQNYELAGSGCTAVATSVDLSSFQTPDGTDITTAMVGDLFYVTFEPETPNEENASFTTVTPNSDGTVTLSGGTRGLKFTYAYNQDTDLRIAHPGGSTVRITNSAPFYGDFANLYNDGTITGLWQFPNGAETPVIGASYVAPTLDTQIPSKKYVDDVAIAGAPDASTTTKGITKLSVAPVAPTIPIAVGDNDPRVTTAWVPESVVTTKGDILIASANATVNRFAVGANGTVPFADSSQTTGYLARAPVLRAFGSVTRASNGTSANVTVAHGLGTAPLFGSFQMAGAFGGTTFPVSYGGSDGVTNSCAWVYLGTTGNTSTNAIEFNDGAGATQVATITYDATNITFHWVKGGGPPAGSLLVFWQVVA